MDCSVLNLFISKEKKMRKFLLVILLISAVTLTVSAEDDWQVKWSNGFSFESADKNFKLKFGGRFLSDWAWISPDDEMEYYFGDLDDIDGDGIDEWVPMNGLPDGTETRAARLFVSGTVYKYIIFKWQYDFAGGDSVTKDAWIGLQFDNWSVKAGHQKEAFSLEELTSSKYTTFMERGLPNMFSPGRNTGIQFSGHALEDSRMTWALGYFRDTNDYADHDEDGGYNFTTRVTGLPFYQDKGRKLIHVGFAYSMRNPNKETVRYRQRPECHTTSRFIDTGNLPIEDSSLFGLELAGVFGPFSFQGEYMKADLDWYNPKNINGLDGYDDPDFDGYYLYGSWFITGENRNYKNSEAAFDRVKPKRNFLKDGGSGAWEVAVRYSNLDLVHTTRYEDSGVLFDGSIYGGELSNITLGLNWYLTPNTRVMFNYINSSIDNDGYFFETENDAIELATLEDAYFNDGGNADIFQLRFQIDF